MTEEQHPQEQAYVLPDIPQHIQQLVDEYKSEVLQPWDKGLGGVSTSSILGWAEQAGMEAAQVFRVTVPRGRSASYMALVGGTPAAGEVRVFASWREPGMVTYGPQAVKLYIGMDRNGRPEVFAEPLLIYKGARIVSIELNGENMYGQGYLPTAPENAWTHFHPLGIDELLLDFMVSNGKYAESERAEMLDVLNALDRIAYTCKPMGATDMFEGCKRFSEWLEEVQKKRPRRRPRKAAAQDEKALFSNSKAERFIFGEGSKAIGPEAYDGREMLLDLGRLKAQTPMRLKDSALDLRAIPADSLGVTWLTSKERYWLTMAQSTWRDNRDSKVTYGSDILKHAGYSNPLKRGMAATMREAAEALTRLTHIHIWLDTTGEDASYKRRAVRRISDRRIVDGRVSLEEYEDGTCDFVIEWQAVDGDTPFPLMDYAQDKGEAFVVPSEAFKFPRACGQISDNVRRALVYIYRQAASKGLSDTVLFDTMLPALGLDGMSSSALGRFRASLKKVLIDWKKRSPQVITSWCWKSEGCKIVGVTVHANRRYLMQTQELVEAENMKKDGPLLPPGDGK